METKMSIKTVNQNNNNHKSKKADIKINWFYNRLVCNNGSSSVYLHDDEKIYLLKVYKTKPNRN